jgi:hypothetical protein
VAQKVRQRSSEPVDLGGDSSHAIDAGQRQWRLLSTIRPGR